MRYVGLHFILVSLWLLSGCQATLVFPNIPQSTEPLAPSGSSQTHSDLLVWLDASAISGKLNGDPISNWEDSSGSGHHAIQAFGPSQPTYLTNHLGGKPVVSFDYTDDYLTLMNGSDFKFADGQNYTVIVLQKTYPAALTYYGHIIGNYLPCPDTNTCRMGFELGSNITTGEAFYSSTSTYGFGNLGSGNISNSWHWLVQKRAGNTVSGYKDGAQEVSFAGGGSYSNTGNEVTIGYTPNLYLKWTGEIAEVLIYNRDLNDTEITNLSTYFHDKWGI